MTEQTTPSTLNERQIAALRWLGTGHGISTNSIGRHLARLGLVKRLASSRGNNCFAGIAVMRSLERRGLACRFLSSQDQWAIALWAITSAGQKALVELPEKAKAT